MLAKAVEFIVSETEIITAWIGSVSQELGNKIIPKAWSAKDAVIGNISIIESIGNGSNIFQLNKNCDVETPVVFHFSMDNILPCWYRSAAVFPLNRDDEPNDFIFLYSDDENFFDDSMVVVMQSLSYEIASHLNSYRYSCQQSIDYSGLEKSDAWIRKVFNTISDAVFVNGNDRKILIINHAAEKLTGYTSEELYGQFTKVIHIDEEHYKDFAGYIKKTMENDGYSTFEYKLKRKNGEIFPSEHVLSILKDDAGNFTGIVSILRDISERKKAEGILNKTLSELARSNKELEQFAYIASHDLKEPLRKIAVFGERLKMEYLLSLMKKIMII